MAGTFSYFGNPTNTPTNDPSIPRDVGSTMPFGNQGWGQGWGMFNPFKPQPRVAPTSVVNMWKTALESGDGGTLMAMSSDSDIRHLLARALGINVNELSNIAMLKFGQASDQYQSMNNNAWTQARSQYVGSRGQLMTPGTTPTSPTGAGGIPTLANPWSNMQMLFRDNTGMLHDPGDNPIWNQLNNAPITPTVTPPPVTWGNGRPGYGNRGRHGGNGRNISNPFVESDRRVTSPNTGTTLVPPPATTTPPPPVNTTQPTTPNPVFVDPRVGNPYNQQ